MATVKREVLVELERQRVVYADRREMAASLFIEIQTENTLRKRGRRPPCRAPARWCGFRGNLVEELLSAIPMCWPALGWFVKSLPHPLTDAYLFDKLQFGSDHYRSAAICGIAWCGNALALTVSLLTGTDRAAECDTEGFVSIREPVLARA